MENKVYYGEYSLSYWLKLMLSRNIILPDYQRHFVWKEDKVHMLLASFQQHKFIPPVTIGAFGLNGNVKNLIIDGQQRLTSVLLMYLNLFPKPASFKSSLTPPVSETDDEDDIDEELVEWTFDKLIEKGQMKEDILSNCDMTKYNYLGLSLSSDFFDNTYLGFSYIVPSEGDNSAQQRYYAEIFRDLNVSGQNLLEIESRRALYYMNDNLKSLFEPDYVKGYSVQYSIGPARHMDFVRYLSFAAAYNTLGSSRLIARGRKYMRRIETYYEEFIYSVVQDDNSDQFGQYSKLFPIGYQSYINKLKQVMEVLNFPTTYPSIIDMDLYMIGLIYTVLYQHKTIDSTKIELLKNSITEKIMELKPIQSHNPGKIVHLRQRISESIQLYNSYAV